MISGINYILGTSLLIVVIVLLRKLLGDKCNPNIRYFLWIFAAVRILVPLEIVWEIPESVIPESSIVLNILTTDQSVTDNEDWLHADKESVDVLNMEKETISAESVGDSNVANKNMDSQYNAQMSLPGEGQSEVIPEGVSSDVVMENDNAKAGKDFRKLLRNAAIAIWAAGSVLMGGYVIAVNLHAFAGIKKRKVGCLKNKVEIYEADGYNCLAGIVKPRIYVSPQVLEDEERCSYVFRHEMEHYRAKDNFWLLVRTVCLVLQWFNPLVWITYYKCQEDCELACDYRVLQRLEQKQREEYAEVLVYVLSVNTDCKRMLTTAMGDDKRFMKKRLEDIFHIGKIKRRADFTILAVVLLVVSGTFLSCSIKPVQENAEDQTAQAVTDSTSNSLEPVQSDERDISLYQGDEYHFDSLTYGATVGKLLELYPDAEMTSVWQGVWESESVYSRSFYSNILEHDVTAKYYFDSNGFKKGVYEIEVDEQQKADVLEHIKEYYGRMLEDMGERVESFNGYQWNQFLEWNQYVLYADKSQNVLRLSQYETAEANMIELLFYHGFEETGSAANGGWPEDVNVCWNVEIHGNTIEKAELKYKEVWFMDFGQNLIVVDPFELGTNPASDDWLGNAKGERITYKLAENCEIWGMLNPACFGKITFEQLVTSELEGAEHGSYLRWGIGINSEGEIEHIIQYLLP